MEDDRWKGEGSEREGWGDKVKMTCEEDEWREKNMRVREKHWTAVENCDRWLDEIASTLKNG